MSFEIRTATRKQTKLRIGIGGPSGAGKTYSALQLAYGITGDWLKVGMIDTEGGRGELYAEDNGFGPYKYGRLTEPFTPEKYIEAIDAMVGAGVECVVIDSMSHEWETVNELSNTIAQARYAGNTWASRSETGPRHQKFIDKIIQTQVHIISCFRSKTETALIEGANGKKEVQKLGMKLIQREGVEYEYSVMLDIELKTHLARIVGKDNSHLFENLDPFLITKEHGKALVEWANLGEPVVPETKPIIYTKADIRTWIAENYPEVDASQYGTFITETTGLNANTEDPGTVLAMLKTYKVRSDNNEQ